MNTARIHNMLALAVCLLAMGAQAQDKAVQRLLPKPQQVQPGKGLFRTAEGIKVENLVGNEAQNVFMPAWAASSDARARRVLRLERLGQAVSPEAYRLHIGTDTMVVSAASREGFMRAWQTVAQMASAKGVPCADIADWPAYKWRGLMIDVVRHFFPVSFLKRQVDVMAQYKFNRLHLHLTDAEGWRMQMKRYPRLTDSVAYRPIEPWVEWRAAGMPFCAKDAPGAYGGFYTQDQLRDLVAYAEERGITLTYQAEEGCRILGSMDETRQIIYNLVDNAVKYNRDGGRVEVELKRQGEEVLLTVADEGVGIPEEELTKIFQRFYRVDKARSRAAGGTGLGLSIVWDTLEKRGGTISAANRPGGGAVFTVRWPQAEEGGGV